MDWSRLSPRMLGFGGLIPFVVLAALTLIGPEGWKDWVSRGLIAYGAVILSFLGGITWGVAVTREQRQEPLVQQKPLDGIMLRKAQRNGQ